MRAHLFMLSCLFTVTSCGLGSLHEGQSEQALNADGGASMTDSPEPTDSPPPTDSPEPPPEPSPAPEPESTPKASPTIEKINAVEKTLVDYGAETTREIWGGPTSKADQIKKYGALDVTQIDKMPPVGQFTNVAGGTCTVVSNIPDGYIVGSTGADPCIIVVIADCNGTVTACHFYTASDVAETFAKLGPFSECARAAIAGGNNTTASNHELEQVINALNAANITIDGILDRVGVYWDAANSRWVHAKIDMASENK